MRHTGSYAWTAVDGYETIETNSHAAEQTTWLSSLGRHANLRIQYFVQDMTENSRVFNLNLLTINNYRHSLAHKVSSENRTGE